MNILDFKNVEPKVLGASARGQDSLIEYIFDKIGETNKFYVEFGAVDGYQGCHTFHLRSKKGWSGLLLEQGRENLAINLRSKFISAENICSIFNEFSVPKDLDFLCVDIDGNEFWVLKSILSQYSPRVIMVESCVRFNPQESFAQAYDPNYRWNGQIWYGASPLAFKKMLKGFNYSIVKVYLDDLLIVHNSLLSVEQIEKPWEEIYGRATPELYNSNVSSIRDSGNWEEI